ncbi:FAD/NAD(P)-binding domain-containing protein [Tilletiaria anomala UBC 951]|uniref:FAD/NAD(P)-binding domain-containing protein n=1 Tax=Tilletiaria anomala (strain ATCC 24038 / CBS 436.72 / UBC 951) TaxID=1037660 RepID=A0A066VUD0_TILAU|nr:FAD/NAD(P)-binding domain-containing protein [Tilletiaria anomala UBC 951]KDN42399.1 FAD/NAD(P)-binding domain-containing protein [Tilletiaria anomala UBC 951]
MARSITFAVKTSSQRANAASAPAPVALNAPTGVRRSIATVADASAAIGIARTHSYRVVVVGAGAAGQAVSHQLALSGFFDAGDSSAQNILVIDPSETHDYQPGWTLVGAGLKPKEEFRKPMRELFATSSEDAQGQSKIDHLQDAVESFEPEKNRIETRDGRTIEYEQLVVCPGIHINWAGIEGLEEALRDAKSSGVSSIYSYDTCSDVFPLITSLDRGRAIFTQPAGFIKCAGAPQKAMWLALDHWKQRGVFSPSDPSKGVQITFATGMPTMFSAPKYSKVLDEMRQERQVEGLFQHDLVKIDPKRKVATFNRPDGQSPLEKQYDLLHATPPMGPLPWIKSSPLAAAEGGFVDVDQATTQHKKYKNIWSIGDSSSLATSKTTAAIASQAPVLVANLLQALASDGKAMSVAAYDGYTSCPLLTEYGKVLLAEFKYGGVPKETFGNAFGIDQAVPRRAFYYLKKDFFPWVYFNSHVKGTWQGPKGFLNAAKLAPSSASSARSIHTASRPSISPRRFAFGNQTRTFSSSPATSRNTPARRPRDPLAVDRSAMHHRLPTGETFIVRPPPSAPSPYTSTLTPNPILDGIAAAPPSPALPPPIKPRTRSSVLPGSQPLTAQQILQLQALRKEDPLKNTASKLAKQFGCSPTFVRIAAPAPKEIKELRSSALDALRRTWGLRKQVARTEKAERRKLW